MTVLFELFISFFLIGLFGFGGGYAMIPLIKQYIVRYGWMPISQFADLVAVSQMTPGPLAVNAATYAGMSVAGLPGAITATLGVSIPAFVIVLIVAHFVTKFRENRFVSSTLDAVRPATVGMIAAAVLFFMQMSVFDEDYKFVPGAAAIFLISILMARSFKVNPIIIVVISAVLGMLLI